MAKFKIGEAVTHEGEAYTILNIDGDKLELLTLKGGFIINGLTTEDVEVAP